MTSEENTKTILNLFECGVNDFMLGVPFEQPTLSSMILDILHAIENINPLVATLVRNAWIHHRNPNRDTELPVVDDIEYNRMAKAWLFEMRKIFQDEVCGRSRLATNANGCEIRYCGCGCKRSSYRGYWIFSAMYGDQPIRIYKEHDSKAETVRTTSMGSALQIIDRAVDQS